MHYTAGQNAAQLRATLCSVFVTFGANYGLQTAVPPQLVVPVPPSAWTTAGTTSVLSSIRAAATTSSTRFTIVFSLLQNENRDIFRHSLC